MYKEELQKPASVPSERRWTSTSPGGKHPACVVILSADISCARVRAAGVLAELWTVVRLFDVEDYG